MSVVSRGAKNAFRNGLRTSAVVLILAISIGLSLSMLVASKAVEGRIADLKSEVSSTILVNPAGSQGLQGGGEPLTADNVAAIKDVAHVGSVSASMSLTLQTEGGENSNASIKMRAFSGKEPGETNLESSIEAGTLGRRFNASGGESAEAMPEIKLPIRALGFNGEYDQQGKKINLTEGRALKDGDTYSALVGKDLAEKNNLTVGSTFLAYDETFTVVGIFDQGTKFANDTVVMPLDTAQELAELPDEVSAIVVQADSIENLESVIADIKKNLGEDNVDVTSSQENVRQAIESLKSVQNISIVGFVASLAASAVIVLMVMFVIVRERRREIGVLKAIGGSNRSIVSQFVIEAVVLVAMGGFIGLGAAFVGSGAIANVLVSSNTSSSVAANQETGPKAGTGPRIMKMNGVSSGETFKDTTELVGDVTTSVGAGTLAIGLAGMIIVAILGSAIPAWLIAKVRPAEVLRGE
ncbi:MAG TPA: FtsX-like permease family protein [Candidatus Saccharimonadales bacterium]|nr:FtsX-like permease family protein [Candidatus Saccharimonadales bacterium]